MRRQTLFLVGFLLSLTLGGCRLRKTEATTADAAPGEGVAPKATSTEAAPPPPAGEAPAPVRGCSLPTDNQVAGLVTLTKGCKLEVKDVINIRAGGVLRIEAGVRLAFAGSTYLNVEGGQVVAAGAAGDPIVFTSAATTQAPGDWGGIYLGVDVVAGTVFDHVHFEYAGQDTWSLRGAVTIAEQKSAKRISFLNCSFENNEQSAIQSLSHKAAFARFQDNTLRRNKISVDADAMVLASIGTGNTFGDPLRTGGLIDENATWPAFGAPVIVRETIKIEGQTAAPTLAVAPGTVLRFAGGTYVSVGEGSGGGLSAPRVTFTSANPTPQPGDWTGLFAYSRTTALDLSGATVEFAGGDGGSSRAALTFYDVNADKVRNVNLTGAIFREFPGAAAAFPNNDCGAVLKGAKIAGTACRKE